MSSDVTKDGVERARPGRDAITTALAAPPTGAPPDGDGAPSTGAPIGAPGQPGGSRRWRQGRRGEQAMVPDAEFRSYYGQPIINQPVWKAPDIPGYIFLGGLAGAGSVLAAGAQLTGRPAMARRMKLGAVGSIGLGTVGLVHDLGRPERFANMLRVLKPTSPMSVGSWLLAAYGPAAGVAALTDLTGMVPGVGMVATVTAAAIGPAVASYTAALLADTAVPAWHDGYRELPFVFVGSAATAAAGLALAASPLGENAPGRRLAFLGAIGEVAAAKRMEHRMGIVAEPYDTGKGRAYMQAGEVLTAAGLAGTLLLGRRSRLGAALSGAALVAASACTRWGIFHAGMESASDPRYTVVPQRDRLAGRNPAP